MSTPMISETTFANVRASLESLAVGNSMLAGETLRAIGLRYGVPMSEADARIATLVFDWQRSNWGAHCVRYAHRHEAWRGEERPDAPAPVADGKRLSLVALFKALQCIHYNCDAGKGSGDTIAQSLKCLDDLLAAYAVAIVSELPEYKAAEWPL